MNSCGGIKLLVDIGGGGMIGEYKQTNIRLTQLSLAIDWSKIHKNKSTTTQIQIQKYKYTNTNTNKYKSILLAQLFLILDCNVVEI